MKLKKIMIKGLGPQGSASINGNLYTDGAVLELPKNQANAYIKAHLAIPILKEEDEKKVEIARKQIESNKKRRNVAIEKAKTKEVEKKEGEK